MPISSDISGLWEFTLIPDEVHLDTSVSHGAAPSDYETYSSVHDQVSLYQNETGDLIGYAGTFRFSGKVTGLAVALKVYVNPDGPYNPSLPIDEMILMSEMNLVIDEYGLMSGNGAYLEDPYFIDLAQDTYTVEARKISSVDKSIPLSYDHHDPVVFKGVEDDICKVIFSVTSYLISALTDGVVRTMSSDCWLHKDGGGYYAFGHEGPGSLFPILTQSIYFPLEWSLCKVRSYSFEVKIEGESLSYEALKHSVLDSPPVKDLFKLLGFGDIDELEQAMDDFYNEYGGFGISLFYDTHTNHYGIYVNHEKGSGAENSDLIKKMKGAFNTNFVYAGHTIHDSWHLRRSDFIVCNTPIIILYIMGTHNVSYN